LGCIEQELDPAIFGSGLFCAIAYQWFPASVTVPSYSAGCYAQFNKIISYGLCPFFRKGLVVRIGALIISMAMDFQM
jgi:hypothetical protein